MRPAGKARVFCNARRRFPGYGVHCRVRQREAGPDLCVYGRIRRPSRAGTCLRTQSDRHQRGRSGSCFKAGDGGAWDRRKAAGFRDSGGGKRQRKDHHGGGRDFLRRGRGTDHASQRCFHCGRHFVCRGEHDLYVYREAGPFGGLPLGGRGRHDGGESDVHGGGQPARSYEGLYQSPRDRSRGRNCGKYYYGEGGLPVQYPGAGL